MDKTIKQKVPPTLDELRHEESELEQENYFNNLSGRPPTLEYVERLLKCLSDTLDIAEDLESRKDDSSDMLEIRKELKHRIGQIIDEEVV